MMAIYSKKKLIRLFMLSTYFKKVVGEVHLYLWQPYSLCKLIEPHNPRKFVGLLIIPTHFKKVGRGTYKSHIF